MESLERLERALVDLRAKQEALRAEGREHDAEEAGRRIHVVEELLGWDRQAVGLLREAKARWENGRREAAKEALQQAAERLEEVHAREKALGAPRPGADPEGPRTGGPVPTREALDHLKTAARHLRAAGAVAEAERVERMARELAERREREGAAERTRAEAAEATARARREEVRRQQEELRRARLAMGAHRPAEGGRGPAGGEADSLDAELGQIRAEVREIRKTVEEILRRLGRADR
jgi:hypothetical protein